jgi:RNA polymerase sigma-B factor
VNGNGPVRDDERSERALDRIPEQQARPHPVDGGGAAYEAAEKAGGAPTDRAGDAGTAATAATTTTVSEAQARQAAERAANQMSDEHAGPKEVPQGVSQGVPQEVPQEVHKEREDRELPHNPRDRSGARALFIELRELPDGSPEKAELRNRLVRMHLPLVEHLARRFRNRGEPLDDLTQVATIGLIKSVDRFDPERGVEFSTYATPTVVGEIKRHFRDKGWAVRVPRRLQELRLSLTSATAELSQQHGRSPTVHELAERLAISEEEVLEGLESANAYSTLSLDVPDTDDESPAVADTLGSEDVALEGVEYRESLKPLLEDLPPREKRILLLRFFGNMTQSQIAQEVGISQMHVSRLLARTLAQLREKLLVEE